MGKIRQLDTQTANLIAAGEVVERPQGVVKELVENAIDAGSTRIEVTLTEGGLSRIVVSDNGSGMDAIDAAACFARHATSKIHDADDLWSIHTLGFRGEALPSIGAVAAVTMLTADGESATRVKIAYGSLQEAVPYPCDQGTTMIVEGLFYRTPARLKHMRSGAYEASLIQDLIMRFALCHPDIAFSLRNGERQVFRTSGSGDLAEVIFQCWGRMPAENAMPIHLEDEDYQVNGFLVKPEVTRASRNFMQVFLNRRLVRSYRLERVIQEGYSAFIAHDRQPMAVLSIIMDPHLLDVNVHPGKWEVRLSKENQLAYLLRNGIRETLAHLNLAHTVSESIQEENPTYYAQTEMTFPFASVRKTPTENSASLTAVRQPERNEEKKEDEDEGGALPALTVLGTLHGRWIVCSCEKGLALVDQRGAHARILYEQLQKRKAGTLSALLVPLIVKVKAATVLRLEELNAWAKEFGVIYEEFGPDLLRVRQIPSWLQAYQPQEFVQDLVDLFEQEAERHTRTVREKMLAQLACRQAMHGGKALSKEESVALLERLAACRNPWQDASHHPTLVIYDARVIAGEFRS